MMPGVVSLTSSLQSLTQERGTKDRLCDESIKLDPKLSLSSYSCLSNIHAFRLASLPPNMEGEGKYTWKRKRSI